MNLSDLRTVLPEKYFNALHARVGDINTTVAKLQYYTFTLYQQNDFLAVWPSKKDGNWIRLLEPGIPTNGGKSFHYKKMVFYNSRTGLLAYVNYVDNPVIPPL